MTTTKTKTQDETFEEQAKKYAACAIGSIREMIEAMEHAAECDGDCSECDGAGTKALGRGQGQASDASRQAAAHIERCR